MYYVTEEQAETIKNFYPQKAHVTVRGIEETIEITSSDIVSGGLSIDRYCTSSSKIEIGSAISHQLTLSLNNNSGKFDDTKFEGAELYVVLEYGENENAVNVPCGYFTVDESPAKLSTIKLTALDRMVMFDKSVNNDLIQYPITIEALLVHICAVCNVSLMTIPSSLINSDLIIPNKIVFENTTYRTILQYICQITATCSFFDFDGKLRLEWYNEEPELTISASDRYSSTISESSITITGIQVSTKEKEVFSAGTLTYAIQILNNPLIQQNHQSVVDNIGSKLIGFSYIPFKATTKPLPFVFPLDSISFKRKDGSTFYAIITHVNVKLNSNTVIEGKGETLTKNSYARQNPLTAQESLIIETIKETVNETLNTRVQAVLEMNEMIANSLGFYKTTITGSDGSQKTYLHDKPKIEDSKTIYTITANGFAFTNSGWNNGSPVWEYGLTKDGNAVFNKVSAYGMEVSDPLSKYSAKITPQAFETYFGEMRTMSANGEVSVFSKMKINSYSEVGRIRIVPAVSNNETIGADIIFVD